jgi:hypothetical protein
VDQRHVLEIWENYVIELYDRTNRPETLEVEPEEEVDTDEKGRIFYKVRWKRLSDDVPGVVLKLLGEGGLKILTKLINTIYETGEWHKDFI